MRYYPILLDLSGRPVVVVGGGKVAWQKVKTLLASKGKVRIVAPQLTAPLKNAVRSKKIIHTDRNYREGDLKGAFLAIAATNDSEVNHRVKQEADKRGILLNVVDCPKMCHFILPALVSRGDFLLTVSTGGKAPALSKRVRQELERQFGPEYGRWVRVLEKVRERLKGLSIRQRREVLSRFMSPGVLRTLRGRKR